jgi:hypothetical protein
MKRLVLICVAIAGCASGSSTLAQQDAPAIDAPKIDSSGEQFVDAMIDGPIDAAPDAMPDAMIDAPIMIDAPLIDAPPDACVPVATELLVNPAFDLSPVGTGWTQVLIDPAGPLISTDGNIDEHSASYKAWLGGYEAPSTSVTDSLSQDVVVPAGTTQLVLTGFYQVQTYESATATTVYDNARLDLTQPNGTPIATVRTFSNLTPVATWTAINFTFPQNLAGQTVRLRMTSTNDFINVTNFYFDTLSLVATHCP